MEGGIYDCLKKAMIFKERRKLAAEYRLTGVEGENLR